MSGFNNDVVYAAGATITGPTTINSGTGTMDISSDAANTTANFATGAGVKLTTLGSTTGASSLALRTGSVGYTLASGSGTIMSATAAGAVTCGLGNFDVTRSNVGAAVTGTISNTDNTNASSNARLNVVAGGASGGDAAVRFTTTGVTDWSIGLDNSDSDAYVISLSASIGSSNAMRIDSTSRDISVPGGNLSVSRAGGGSSDVSVTTSNTSNGAGAAATNYISVGGGSAADAAVQYSVSGAATWTHGIDNSDSDAFALAASTALGTTNVMRASTTGLLNYPLQPAFLAYLASTVTNVTGDGTAYTVIFDTEVYDQGTNFNLGTSTFTAPITGRYKLDFAIRLTGGTVIAPAVCSIVTSNRTYTQAMHYTVGGTTEVNGMLTVIADMDTSDTATFRVTATDSGGKIDDVSGTVSSALVTYCSGALLC